MPDELDAFRACLVVPHYEQVEAFERFLPSLAAAGCDVFVVDDGSSRITLERCTSACDSVSKALPEARIHLLIHRQNRGKGAAVYTAAAAAAAAGFTHIVQVDADGQHDLADLQPLVRLANDHPTAIISGLPVFGDDAPRSRVHGRKLTTAMIAIETLGGGIHDGLCGYRVYPLIALEILQDRFHIAPRMGFDTDVLVKASWLDITVLFVPTAIRYPADGRSHFHYLRDNLRLIKLHLRLLTGAAVRAPTMLLRRFTR